MDVSLGSSHPGVKLNPHNSSMHSYPEPTCSKVRPLPDQANSLKGCSLGPSNEHISYIKSICKPLETHLLPLEHQRSCGQKSFCHLLLHGTEDATQHSTPPVAQPSPSEKVGEIGLPTTPPCHWFRLPPGPWFYTRIMIWVHGAPLTFQTWCHDVP